MTSLLNAPTDINYGDSKRPSSAGADNLNEVEIPTPNIDSFVVDKYEKKSVIRAADLKSVPQKLITISEAAPSPLIPELLK